MRTILKALIPDRIMSLPVLGGPFRGARVQVNPRHALRKVLGIYEHELTPWFRVVIPRVSTCLDVGANDGYFTFGCAAALRRLKRPGEILAFEPEQGAFDKLLAAKPGQESDEVRIHLYRKLVGSEVSSEMTTLNEIASRRNNGNGSTGALIKIDVEGAEIDVIAAASSWLNPTNYFVIEVHEEPFLASLTKTFQDHGLKLKQINQKPLPIIGFEARSRSNWWLVSEPS